MSPLSAVLFHGVGPREQETLSPAVPQGVLLSACARDTGAAQTRSPKAGGDSAPELRRELSGSLAER